MASGLPTPRFPDFLPVLLHPLLECIAAAPASHRKTIVLRCRALQPRATNPSVHDQFLTQSPTVFDDFPLPSTHTGIDDGGQLLDSLMTSPATAPLIINLCRELPLPLSTIREFSDGAITKEYLIHASLRRDAAIDWSPMFRGLPYPIHPAIPTRPMAHINCNKILRRWMRKVTVSSSRIYTLPPYSKKRPSSHSVQDLQYNSYGHAPSSVDVAIGDIEQSFHWKRRKILGASEGKLKWTPADLKPRMYYAIGGDQFQSAETRDLLLDLQQQFVFVGSKTRVDPSRLDVGPYRCAIAYDYSTFSSNLSEIQNFLGQLADFADEEKASALRVDPELGLVRVPLSELIRGLEACHDRPQYSLPFDETRSLHEAGQAGFLGTYSNITASTLLHGLFVSALRDNYDTFNVAGDDGLILLHEHEIDEVFAQLELLGALSMEKVWVLHAGSGPVISLKRPLYFDVHEFEEGEIQERLVSPMIPSFPTLSFYLERNPAYTFFNVRYSLGKPDTFRHTAIRDITRYLSEIATLELTELDVDVVGTFLAAAYSYLGLPTEGAIRYSHAGHTFLVPPIIGNCWVNRDPFEHAIDATVAPRFFTCERLEDLPFEEYMYELDAFECNMTPYLMYLSRMGYLQFEKELDFRVFSSPKEARSFLKKHFRVVSSLAVEPSKPVYRFLVLSPIPSFFRFVGESSGSIREPLGHLSHDSFPL